MARKTFDIAAYKVFVNRQLANPSFSIEEKKVWVDSIEFVLGDNYQGFNYLIQDGNWPSIKDPETGYYSSNPAFTEWNEYMRFYY